VSWRAADWGRPSREPSVLQGPAQRGARVDLTALRNVQAAVRSLHARHEDHIACSSGAGRRGACPHRHGATARGARYLAWRTWEPPASPA